MCRCVYVCLCLSLSLCLRQRQEKGKEGWMKRGRDFQIFPKKQKKLKQRDFPVGRLIDVCESACECMCVRVRERVCLHAVRVRSCLRAW